MNAVLEALARDHVGDDKSDLSFVTVSGRGVVAVFVGDTDGAIDYCEKLDPKVPAFVEDRTGVVWDNPASDELQRVEDE